eukprot:TRINITY_DN15325_c0_g1_i2.p1 TRINITY_DN15325_c0_g1~~TRINITY_DN15325_c0_g1_i2.p1  ORF type:complete len:312 (-),score=50.87 TRINITY_DN15325_c0_g1_i2:157-1092(-)
MARYQRPIQLELLVSKLIFRSDTSNDRNKYFIQWKLDKNDGRTLPTAVSDGAVIWTKVFRVPPFLPPDGKLPLTFELLKERVSGSRTSPVQISAADFDLAAFLSGTMDRQEYHIPLFDCVLEIRLKATTIENTQGATGPSAFAHGKDSLEDTLAAIKKENEQLMDQYERVRTRDASRYQNAGAPADMERGTRVLDDLAPRRTALNDGYSRSGTTALRATPHTAAQYSSDDEGQHRENMLKLSREAAEYKRLLMESIRREELLSSEMQRYSRGTRPRSGKADAPELPPFEYTRESDYGARSATVGSPSSLCR